MKRMRLFAQAYPDFQKSAQPVHQLLWGHIFLLLHRVNDQDKRNWYANETVKNGSSRSVLEMQIESGLYERQGGKTKKITNFHESLSAPKSDLAHEILKDPYNLIHS